MNWFKIQQKTFQKTFKQYSGLIPNNFKDHQNDLLLNLEFGEGLDEELVTLTKQHKLN